MSRTRLLNLITSVTYVKYTTIRPAYQIRKMVEQVPIQAQKFKGSCHCGFITYNVRFSPKDHLMAARCNCTVCEKPGYTSLTVEPTDFELLTPSSKSELPDYQPRSKDIHRYFCNKCGVHIYGEGKYVFEGGEYKFFTVNLHSLDQPQEGLDLSLFKFEYWDGRNDNWFAGKKKVPWQGGSL